MILRVTVTGEVECHETRSRSESEPEEGAQSVGVDAKPSDLHLARTAPISVEKLLDEPSVGVKGQSNLEIARTPRKAFRCRVGWSP